ncbi:hypothetical protein [Aquiflexum gelatinilyticum]|jgi:hypothetical protein|uniref:hypothetical protein n=1 Tax=Aquiflexum gelatinilyticum TaxID=2961943 RepID=UPI0021682D83|nr:hypothetical protein [Aquiflexum gelatinilyticum]MCS4433069.1 hypothetical protein [Aquiflexum gelatinilyticum]
MKLIFKISYFFFLMIVFACGVPPEEPSVLDLEGSPGNPRFNLQFTNHENVDLDLIVETPGGSLIFWDNPTAENGMLDLDCFCGECENGPNENIFWEDGSAPSGTYTFWVNYYQSCNGKNEPSEYTLHVVKNNKIIDTKKGVLGSGATTTWTHIQP